MGLEHHNRQILALDQADLNVLNRILTPLREAPRWAIGIGAGIGVFGMSMVLLFGAPLFFGGFVLVMGLGFGALGYWGASQLSRSIKADIRLGRKHEVVGLLQKAYTRAPDTSKESPKPTQFLWLVDGVEIKVPMDMYKNAAPGSRVRICYLPTADIIYLAESTEGSHETQPRFAR